MGRKGGGAPKTASIIAVAKDTLRQNPDANNYQLAKKCEELKLVNDYRQALNVLRYSVSELDQLRQTFKAYHTTQILPLALKRHHEALKDETMNHKEALPFIDLSYKREYGLDKIGIAIARDINIGQIQVLNQVLLDQPEDVQDVPLAGDLPVKVEASNETDDITA